MRQNNFGLLKSALFILIGLFLFKPSANAGSVLGADMSWKCLGGDSFLVTVTGYRDCNGSQISNKYLKVQDACGSTASNYLMNISGGDDITPVCPGSSTRCQSSASSFTYGIQQWAMTAVVKLSGSCCNYVFSWKECCRDSSITTGAAAKGFYIEGRLNKCLAPYDNSPYFTNPPVGIFCKNSCTIYNPAANDIDNTDSLHFKLIAPQSDSGKDISYNSGYSYSAPFKYYGYPNPNTAFDTIHCGGFRFDGNTGEFRFKPTQTDLSPVAFAIEEWRHDSTGKAVKIGETRRDLSIYIIDCPGNVSPRLSGINGTKDTFIDICVGQSTCFTVSTYDSGANDTVKMVWNRQIRGATFVVAAKKKWPAGTFCWQPGKGDLRAYPYRFVVTAINNHCPVQGRTSKTFIIRVNDVPYVKVKTTVKSCGNVDFEAFNNGTVKADHWEWYSEDGKRTLMDTGFALKWKYRDSGWHKYRLMAYHHGSGCSTSVFDSVYIQPYVWLNIPGDTTLCSGSSVTINSSHAGGKGPYYYTWSYGRNGKQISQGYDSTKVTLTPTHDTTVYVRIVDGTGCDNFDSMRIYINYPPKPALGPDIHYCDKSYVWLKHHIKKTVKTSWLELTPSGPKLLAHSDSFPARATGTYIVSIKDSFGCVNSDTIKVTLSHIDVKPQTYTACFGDSLSINAGKGGENFRWTDLQTNSVVSNDSILKITSAEPPLKNGNYDTSQYRLYRLCSWTTAAGVTCEDCDTLRLKVHMFTGQDEPTFSILTDTAQCLPDSFAFKKTSTYNNFLWSFGDGSVSSLGNPSHTYSRPGRYEVRLSLTDSVNGCKISASQYVSVYNNPMAKPIVNDSIQCLSGNNFQFSDDLYHSGNGLNYRWYFGDGDSSISNTATHSYGKSGVFTVRLLVTNSNGCKDSFSKTVKVLAVPSASISGPDSAYLGDTLQFDTQKETGRTYHWTVKNAIALDSASDNISIYFDSTGTAELKLLIITKEGCTAKASKTVTIRKRPNAIAENVDVHNLELYPNPAGDILNIRLSVMQPQKLELRLCNIHGKTLLLKNWQLSSGINEMNLNLRDLKAGCYLIKIVSTQGIYVKTFVKQ